MSVVRVTERRSVAAGSFEAWVAFDDHGDHEVRVGDPLLGEPGGEELLAWYFEEHLRFPFLDRDRAAAAERLLADYGCQLFGQLFEADSDCAYGFRRARDAGFDGYQLEIVGGTDFQRLHWEALRESPQATPLGIRMPVVRRVQRPVQAFDVEAPGPTLNVLVVTARPHGPSDVGYRTVSRPLMAALRQAQIPLNVDLVRPGTWETLKQHLEDARDAHGSGWYGIVHFDVHGAVARMEQLLTDGQSRLAFGAADGEAARNEDAYLFFETPSRGDSAAVAASRVAALLGEHRVPVAVLNACQSAMQWGSEASLAQSLVQAGVPVAVGMAYSVTVTAAERMMPEIYRQLADGKEIVDAVHKARSKLFEYRARRAYFDQELELDDWVLPVAFSQRPVRLRPRDASPAEESEIYARKARLQGEPEPEYGFLGRDLDIQEIERRVLSSEGRNELLVHGMAGAGKSTLLEHLAWWWQATGLVDRVFRFSYEDRAWTCTQVFHEIINRLLTGADRSLAESRPESLSDPETDEKLERVADLLRAQRHLLILDNAESVTATPASIPHALTGPEQDRLRRFLSRLRGGKTIVLVGSRGTEQWLAAGTFTDNTYNLGGLDPQAASELVERVLRRHGGGLPSTAGETAALRSLTELLGGFPLALTVVLPAVAASTPSHVLELLRRGEARTDPESVIRNALELSHGRLDPALQHSLLMLAPFTGVVPTNALDEYRRSLDEHEEVRQLGGLDIPGAIKAAIDVGLAVEESVNHVRLQPTLPFFLRTRLADRPALLDAIGRAHRDLYEQLGQELYLTLQSNDPAERGAGLALTYAEYANLTSALARALADGLPLIPLVTALEEYLDQTHQETARAELLEKAIIAVEGAGDAERNVELAGFHNLAGVAALARHELADARRHHEQELAILEPLGDRQALARTHHQLGIVAQEQRRFGDAEHYFKQALEIKLEHEDRHGAASTYHQLGRVAQEQRQFDEAQRYNKQALEIELEYNDRPSASVTYHQLGVVAMEQRRLEEAERYYNQALEIKLEYKDRHSAASTYHQLGIVAQEQRDLAQAERYYKQSLEIELEYNDRHGAAVTYHQLGRVAQDQQRIEEAERYFTKALELKLEYTDRHGAASTYHQLGRVARQKGQLEDAERLYKQALEIEIEYNDPHRAAITYRELGALAEQQQRLDEAERYYRAAVEASEGRLA